MNKRRFKINTELRISIKSGTFWWEDISLAGGNHMFHLTAIKKDQNTKGMSNLDSGANKIKTCFANSKHTQKVSKKLL